MCLLVAAHLHEDGATALVAGGQLPEMGIQMTFHLPLGLGHESEAGPVGGEAGRHAHGKGARIPKGVEQARPGTQFVQALFAPGQMVGLLPAGLFQQGTDRRIAGYQAWP